MKKSVWKRRAVWLLVIVLAGVSYLFGNGPGSMTVLIAAVLIPAVLIVFSKLGAKHLCVELALPGAGEKGRPVPGSLTVENGGVLPASGAGCQISCRNLFTGETQELTLGFSVRGKSRAEIDFELSSDHCGALAVSAARFFVRDVFGLTVTDIPCAAEQTVLIGPDTFDMELTLVDESGIKLDSNRYSMTKPGCDPSETFDIREYVLGDPVKSVHWKLSQKSERLMVRQLGLPIVDRVLLLLETTLLPEADPVGAEEIDALAETFVTVSNALLTLGVGHTVGWKDADSGAFEACEMTSPDDLPGVAEKFLQNPVRAGDGTVAGCFLKEYEKCGYTHVAVVSPYVEPDVSGLYNGNRVTVLVSSPERGRDGMQPDGVYVATFSGSPERDLGRLEL